MNQVPGPSFLVLGPFVVLGPSWVVPVLAPVLGPSLLARACGPMGVYRFEDLHVWQAAKRQCDRVGALITPPAFRQLP